MKSFLSFILLFCFTNLNSQSLFKAENKVFSSDLSIGIPIFYGDISNKISYSIATKFNWHPTQSLALNVEFGFGSLNGFDEKDNNSFSNKYVKTMFGGEVYFLNIFHLNKISNFFQPFGGISIGLVKSDIVSSEISGIKSNKMYSSWAFSYQYVGGLKFKLAKNFDLNLKTVIHIVKSDLLDNYNPDVNANKHNDAFSIYSVGLTYHIGKKNKVPIIWTNNDKNRKILNLKEDGELIDEEETNSPLYNSVYLIDKKIKELENRKIELENKKKEENENVFDLKPNKENSNEQEHEFDCAIKY